MRFKKRAAKFLSAEKPSSKLILFLIFLASSFLLFLPLFLNIDYRSLTTLGLIGLFIINFLGSATLFFPTPAILSVAVAGASFNPLLVAFIAAVGAGIGETIAYLFGYSSMEFLALRRHKRTYKLLHVIIHWKGGILIPIFAFFPNPVFDGLGILAGISKFPLKRFIFFTSLGRLLRNIGIAYLGLFLS